MKIRQADENDIAEIAAIEAECFSDPWPADMIVRLLPRFTVAADDGGAVMGYLALSTVLDEGNIDNIAVAPAHRRRGAADDLVSDALARGRGMGLAFVSLEVRASNLPAIRLYEKHGFAAVGRRKSYYERPREDAIIMTRIL